ncbi:MAG: hypothetical protein GY711_04325 [bacterium]|nr:hypothetical protein [bacterium]
MNRYTSVAVSNLLAIGASCVAHIPHEVPMDFDEHLAPLVRQAFVEATSEIDARVPTTVVSRVEIDATEDTWTVRLAPGAEAMSVDLHCDAIAQNTETAVATWLAEELKWTVVEPTDEGAAADYELVTRVHVTFEDEPERARYRVSCVFARTGEADLAQLVSSDSVSFLPPFCTGCLEGLSEHEGAGSGGYGGPGYPIYHDYAGSSGSSSSRSGYQIR